MPFLAPTKPAVGLKNLTHPLKDSLDSLHVFIDVAFLDPPRLVLTSLPREGSRMVF